MPRSWKSSAFQVERRRLDARSSIERGGKVPADRRGRRLMTPPLAYDYAVPRAYCERRGCAGRRRLVPEADALFARQRLEQEPGRRPHVPSRVGRQTISSTRKHGRGARGSISPRASCSASGPAVNADRATRGSCRRARHAGDAAGRSRGDLRRQISVRSARRRRADRCRMPASVRSRMRRTASRSQWSARWKSCRGCFRSGCGRQDDGARSRCRSRRWCRVSFKPALLAAGGRRAECWSHDQHVVAHAWLRRFGFVATRALKRGRSGERFILFGWEVS